MTDPAASASRASRGRATSSRPPSGPAAARAERQLHLLQLLQTSGPASAGQLAAELRIPEPEVLADIGLMAAAGIPVSRTAAPPAGYQVPGGYRQQLAHARRLASALQQLQGAPGPVSGQHLAAALGISRQTLIRDARALRSAGIAVSAAPGGAGGYQLPGDCRDRLDGLSGSSLQLMILAGMAAPAEDTIVASWAYAVHGDLPGAVIEELRRAHELRAGLVAAARQREIQVEEIWAACPELDQPRAELARAAAAAAALAARGREEARRDLAARTRELAPPRGTSKRERGRPTKETLAEIGAARRERDQAARALREARQAAYPSLQAQFAATLDDYRKAVAALRRAAVAGGLYWATANAVSEQHRIAMARIAGMRDAGRRAGLQDRPWDGTGTITVQLQRLAHEPPRSPDRLAAPEGRYRNQALLQPWVPPGEWDALPRRDRRRRQAGTLSFRVGSGALASLEVLPVVLHRMLPENADVARIEITRRRIGTRHRAQVTVVARVPRPSPRTAGRVVAVLACWHPLPDGAIRAALVKGAGTPPPRLLAMGVARDHGTWAEVVIPASWLELSRRTDGLRSRRSQGRTQVRRQLSGWLTENPGYAGVLDPDGTLTAPGAGEALAAAAARLRATAPPGFAEPAALLEEWRRADRRLHEWEANERDQLLSRRADVYGIVASWVTSEARLVVMDQRPAPSAGAAGDDTTGPAPASARLVAPSVLRVKITDVARRRGAQARLIPVPHPPPPHDCGAEPAVHAAGTPAPATCPGCGADTDPDVGAIDRLLAAAVHG